MSETKRESGAGADVEVWEHTGTGFNSDPRMQCVRTYGSALPECSGNGWYWRSGDDLHGPFTTEAEARADAAENDGDRHREPDRLPCDSCGIPIPMPQNDEPEALLCDKCLEAESNGAEVEP